MGIYQENAAPKAKELTKFLLALREGGKRDQQIMIVGYLKHVGLNPHPSVIETFSNDLEGYKFDKGSIQYPLKHG